VKTPAEAGYQEPALPGESGANINCSNVDDAIADMSDYALNEAAGPDWHLMNASEDHEWAHVTWHQANTFTSFWWSSVEAGIESHVLGTCPSMDQSAAISAKDSYLAGTGVNAWWDRIQNSEAPEEEGYAAGQATLDTRIAQLQTWKNQNCP
jgi:hypothetical protein